MDAIQALDHACIVAVAGAGTVHRARGWAMQLSAPDAITRIPGFTLKKLGVRVIQVNRLVMLAGAATLASYAARKEIVRSLRMGTAQDMAPRIGRVGLPHTPQKRCRDRHNARPRAYACTAAAGIPELAQQYQVARLRVTNNGKPHICHYQL
jgi:hypothetical protein